MLGSSGTSQRLLACALLAAPVIALAASILYALNGPELLPGDRGKALGEPQLARPPEKYLDRERLRLGYTGGALRGSAVVLNAGLGKAAMTEADDVVPPPPLNPDIVLLFSRKDYVPDSGNTNDLDLSSLIAMVAGADSGAQPIVVPPPLAAIAPDPTPDRRNVDAGPALRREVADLPGAHQAKPAQPPATAAIAQPWIDTRFPRPK